MATKLGLYNGALLYLGERALVSLSEEGEAKRALDQVYDDGLIYCLEQGLWNFATRTVEIGSNPSVTPAFGYIFVFDKPSDWVRTVEVSADPTFANPLLRVTDEGKAWHANVDPLYVRYVSKDVGFGLDLSGWPETFTEAVEVWLALKIVNKITSSATDRDELKKIWTKCLADARSKDALNEATRFPPQGTWVQSRWGGRGTRRREDF